MDFSLIGTYLLSILKDFYPFILAGGTAVGALYFAKWLMKNPENDFNKWYPLVIQAVLHAEKLIPDNTPNKSLAKADAALKMFNDLYTKHTGAEPSQALKDWVARMKELVVLQLKTKKETPKV